MPATEMQNSEAVRNLYENAFNRNQPELLSAFIGEDVIFHGVPDQSGIEAYQTLVARLRTAFPDQHFTIHDLIANGDRVVVRWTMDATHQGVLAGIPPTGKRIQQRGNVIYRFEDGKVAEIWAQMDLLGTLRQLGVTTLPVPNQGAAR